MAKMQVTMTVNGRTTEALVEPRTLLIHFLREQLGLTGAHIGCETGHCGACTVDLDGRSVKSCTVFAVQADGSQLTTVEGLAGPQGPHPVQDEFDLNGAAQCGFCTPGILCSAAALLRDNPHATRDEIKRALAGNLCRCTGYTKIYEAVERAGERMAQGSGPGGQR